MSNVQSRTPISKRLLSILLLAALLFGALPGSLLARESETVAAQEDATELLLGEYVQQPAAAGDVFAYSIYLPEEGEYMISPDDEEAAVNFSAVIYDEAGEAVYEGPLTMEPVLLSGGQYTIEVTAEADGFLSFFTLGMIGTMSDDDRSPGKLYNGSVYSEEDVSEGRYATITIPDVGYPQEVLFYFQAGDGDSFYISLQGGENVSKYVNSDDMDMVRFYSQGGEYTLTVEPSDRRSSFTAIVFLAGAPVEVALDGEVEATLSEDTDTQVFRFGVDDVYDDVTITLTPTEENEAELYMAVVDRYTNGNFYIYGETQDDGSITASTGALLPGEYYIIVNSYDGLEATYTLGAVGEPGAPMQDLSFDEAVEGTLEDGSSHYFRLEGVEPGTFVRVTLASDAEDADFDLHVGMAQPLNQWSSTATGPNEEVILIAPTDGTYYVQVLSYSGSGDYELAVEEISGVGMIDTNELLLQTIGDDSFIVYGFEIDEPGRLLSVLLVSLDASDLDLSVVHYGPNGVRVHDLSSASTGSSEIVSQAAAETGIYEVRVRSFGEGGDFGLLVRVDDPAALLGASGGQSSSNASPVFTAGASDDFSDPESGWPVDEEAGAYGYADGVFQITVDPDVYRWVLKDADVYEDISLEVDVTLAAGGADAYAGLICRSTEDGYFYTDISPAGDFTIGQISGGDVNVLADWTESDAIDTSEGAVNLLRMDCIGDTITAYVNGELLGTVDVEAAAGGYGFEAGNLESASEAAIFHFDNLLLSQP